MALAHGQPKREGAFTLIEMLAVALILALVLGIAVPNVGLLQRRQLDAQARNLVALLELARQRAVMTGTPHRVWIDLEAAVYRLEWYVTEADEGEGPRPLLEYDLRGATPLPLSPPERTQRAYHPIPGREGDLRELPEDFEFRGLETDDGWIDRGEVVIGFDRDGTSTYAELLIQGDGDEVRALEILPLADAVRVRHEES